VGHLCAILREMKDNAIDSKRIASWFNERGLQDIAAFLLDVAKPFGVLAAQTAYLIEPIFGGHRGLMHDLAQFLEDPDQMDELMDQLYREEDKHG
jgi:hypothetical protein